MPIGWCCELRVLRPCSFLVALILLFISVQREYTHLTLPSADPRSKTMSRTAQSSAAAGAQSSAAVEQATAALQFTSVGSESLRVLF